MIEKIAKIQHTFLGVEDHGIFTAILDVDYGGSGQGIGQYCLDKPVKIDGKTVRQGTAYGHEFVMRIIAACGVDKWESVAGRTIFVYLESDSWGAKVVGIGPLPTERGRKFLFDDIKDM